MTIQNFYALVLLCLFTPNLFAEKALSKIDKVIGTTVDSISEEDTVTGEISLNFVQSEDAYIKGLKSFLIIEIESEKQGIRPLPNTHDSFLRAKRIYERIRKASHYKDSVNLKFAVYNSDAVNAYATGGGHIAIFKGLMDVMTDDEVAYVIGHELAHNAASHPFEQGTNLILNKVVGRDLKDGYVESFSSTQEQEADRIGILYTTLAGIDPNSSVSAWAKFITNDYREYAYFRTHPANRERAARNQYTANRVAQYRVPNAINPKVDEVLVCNVLYCKRDSERPEDGKGGGILKALELIAVTARTNRETKDELKKQEREIALSAPNVRWTPGWAAFRGTVERHGHITGLSFGLAGNQGRFYYNFNGQVLEGLLQYYSQGGNGYWYRWSDGYGTGNLYLQPYSDGSLRGIIYIDDGSRTGRELGDWAGSRSS